MNKEKMNKIADRADKLSETTDKLTGVDDIMRQKYRPLTDDEKQQMKKVKNMGEEFVNYLNNNCSYVYDSSDMTPYHRRQDLERSIVKMEEAVMWAVKHITK